MTPAGKTWLIAILILIVLTGIFFAGYFTYKGSHLCLVSYDTTYVHDTVTHTIINRVPYYVQKLDTIIVADTVFIPVDADSIDIAFYSTYQYTRTFEDTLLKAVLEDRVTQNKPAVISFDYTIKRPQQIIQNTDNSISYTKYLYIAGSLNYPDAKYSDISAFYASRRTIFGLGYIPFQNNLKVTFGTTIAKIK